MKIVKNEQKLFKIIKFENLIKKISSGSTPSTKNKEYWIGGNINWMTSGETNHGIIKKVSKKITPKGLSSISNKIFKPKTIMLALAGQGKTKGQVSILDIETSCNQSLAAIFLKDDNEPYYYYYLLKSMYKTIRSIVGEGREGLNLTIIKNLKVINPDKKQQEKIAHVLSMQEEQIERIKGLLKKLEKRNQYYAEKLLSGELRIKENPQTGQMEFYENEEWQDVVLNGEECKIPNDWNKRKLLDEVELTKGISIHSSLFNYNDKGLQFLRTGDVWEESSSKKDMVFFNGEVLKKYIKEKEDYLACFEGFNKKIGEGTIGLVTNNGEGIISSHLYKVNNKNIEGKYFSVSILKSSGVQKILMKNAVGSTVLSSTKCIKDIEIKIPLEKELVKIELFLQKIYSDVESLKKLLPKEEKRFQWMLDNLLSGEYEIID